MTRKRRIIAGSIAVALFLIWALVAFWVGPSEIARAYRGESLAFLNDFVSGRATISLEEYLADWTRMTSRLGWLLLVAVLAGYGIAELAASGPGRRTLRNLAERFRRLTAAARDADPATQLRFGDALLVAAAIGLATGAVEGLFQFVRRFVFAELDYLMGPVGPEVVWLVPLTTAVVFLLVGATLSLILRFAWPRVLRMTYLLLPLLTLSLFTLSRALFHRIAWWAAVLLALGVAVRLAYASRFLTRHSVRRVATICIAVLLVTEAGAAVLLARRGGQELASLSSSAERPNVLLIILDTVRAASISLYGYSRPTTPVLEGLGEQAITFDMAFVPSPWTLPSHASFFTGRQPHELKVDWLTPLDETFPTVAEWFSQHGYSTGGFVANMTVCGEQFGLSRGFGHYEDAPVSWRSAVNNTWLTREILKSARKRFGYHRIFLRKSAEEVNRSFLDWQAETEQPFFAFLNYYDAHAPYGPPQDSLRAFSAPGERFWWIKGGQFDTEEDLRQLNNAYDDGIHYIDAQIGVLLDTLRQRGVLENTLVVITSDHGEEFKEHGHLGHGVTLYRQALHVPFVVLLPGAPQSGRRVAHPVGLTRLAATLVDLAGIGEGSPFPGSPIALSDTAPGDPGGILSEATAMPDSTGGNMRSLIYQGHHYIVGDEGEELYDLASDPGEFHDLSSGVEGRRLVESLRGMLEETLNGAGR